MNVNDLKNIAEELKKHPVPCTQPGKRLFLWYGAFKEVNENLPQELVKTLDISQLDISENNLTSEDNIRRAITKALKSRLTELYKDTKKQQQILVVSSSELIARYNVGLTEFYDYYISDKTMVIILLPKFEINFDIDKYSCITLDEQHCVNYFIKVIGEENMIKG